MAISQMIYRSREPFARSRGVGLERSGVWTTLPTFPWRPGTLGAVLTAIALPLGLWVATRLLERVI